MLKPGTADWLRDALREGKLSRAAVARQLCERDGWRNQKGELCAASARKGLPRVAAELGLPLPPARHAAGGCRRRSRRRARRGFPPLRLQCSLEELGEVSLRLADTAKLRRHYGDLLAAEHPLGRGLAPGCRLVYGIRAGGQDVGVASFVAAPMRLRPRDKHLGWDERTRRRNLPRLVSQDRFLVRPGVVVQNLASHMLGLTLRRLARDWQRLHGSAPVAVETCVEQERSGTCYKAAGFEHLGQTGGLPRGAKEPSRAQRAKADFREPERQRKQVWVKGLARDWERVLREPARPVLGGFPRLGFDSEDAHWSRREFERSDLPDGRLRERLKAMGAAWEQRPGECLPEIFPAHEDQRAAYRFLCNKRVSMEHILAPHREAMVDRCQLLAGTVLLVQDTTTLNYTGLRKCTSGLGPLKKRSESSRGLHVHASLAYTEGRRPLGVSGLEVWGRPLEEPTDEREKESRRWLRGLRQGFELGRACPDQRIVVVGDRESDIYELFRERERREQAGEENVELLVRVNLGRQRKVRVWDARLRSLMLRPIPMQADLQQGVRFRRKIQLASQGGKRARKRRTVETRVSIGPVEVQPPEACRKRGEAGVEAWLVHVEQTDAQPGEDPLEWLLLSTAGALSKRWAKRIVGWYEARWSIEEFFKVLKSGARIEDRRLRTAAALSKCLVFDAVTAWQVSSLARYARDAPHTPVDEVLTWDEITVLWTTVQALGLWRPSARDRAPPRDIRTWVVWLAMTSGFRSWKRRPLPGDAVLWRACANLGRLVQYEQGRAGPMPDRPVFAEPPSAARRQGSECR